MLGHEDRVAGPHRFGRFEPLIGVELRGMVEVGIEVSLALPVPLAAVGEGGDVEVKKHPKFQVLPGRLLGRRPRHRPVAGRRCGTGQRYGKQAIKIDRQVIGRIGMAPWNVVTSAVLYIKARTEGTIPEQEAKSISHETTFEQDIDDTEVLRMALGSHRAGRLAVTAARAARSDGPSQGTVRRFQDDHPVQDVAGTRRHRPGIVAGRRGDALSSASGRLKILHEV